jgi:hypothetical protein
MRIPSPKNLMGKVCAHVDQRIRVFTQVCIRVITTLYARVFSPVWLLDAVVEHTDQHIRVFWKVHHKLLMLLYLHRANT